VPVPRDPGTRADLAAELYDLHLNHGWTQTRLAGFYVLDRRTVSRLLAEYRESIPEPSRVEMRKQHLDELERIRLKMMELVEMEGAPVTAGKDGNVVHDPGTKAVVRDYSLRIAATRELLKVIERQAKQFGVDAPTQVEHTGTVEVVDSVNAELAKLAKAIGLNGPVDQEISAAAGITGQEGTPDYAG
jgi:hypothetical protein